MENGKAAKKSNKAALQMTDGNDITRHSARAVIGLQLKNWPFDWLTQPQLPYRQRRKTRYVIGSHPRTRSAIGAKSSIVTLHYITLPSTRDSSSPCKILSCTPIVSVMLPPRQPCLLARLTRWQV